MGLTNFSRSGTHFLDTLTLDGLGWLAVFCWLAVPLAAVIILHSVEYDAWRQMFFIYPAMLLIAVFGLKSIYGLLSPHFKNQFTLSVVTVGFVFVGLLEPVLFSLRYHPFENVFFNVLAGSPTTLRQNFDMDYWGLSYKQGLDYILSHDPSDKIYIADSDLPQAEYILYMLPADQASRLVYAPFDKSDYFITTFRYHPQPYDFGREYFSIDVRGTKIMTVYTRKQ